jgi:hypothetical protein
MNNDKENERSNGGVRTQVQKGILPVRNIDVYLIK